MVNFSFLGIVLIGILFLVAPAYQRGNLYADYIYSAAGDVITIDTLESTQSEITNSKADTVSFGNFDSITLQAQALNIKGSFALLESSNNLDLQSTAGNAYISAGNNLNVNGNTIGITSNGGDVDFSADNGEISLIAGSQFTATAAGFNVYTEVGGALFSSQGGDISIQSSGNIVINSNDEFNLRSTYDLLITTPKDLSVTASTGEIDIASLNDVTLNAQNSLSIKSDEERISFNAGDYIITNSESFTATGSGALKIQSFTSGIRVNAFGTTSFNANSDLTLEGDTKGVSLFSNGENTGIIQLTSNSRSIYFTSEGNGDENTGVLVNVDTVSGDFSTGAADFYSRGDGVIRSNGDINIAAGGSFQVNTENVDITSAQFGAVSSLGFSLDANNINLYAFDDATAGNTLGLIDVAASNIRYTATQDIVLHGGDLSFTAGTGDLTLSALDITISASRGDNSQHSITTSGSDLLYSGLDAYFYGGQVDIYGGSQNIFAGGDITQISDTLSPNFIRNSASDDINFNAPDGSLTHQTDELTFYSFYAGGDSLEAGLAYTTVGAITAETDTGYDISLVSKTDFGVLSTTDSILFQSYDANIEVTEQFKAVADVISVTANDFSLNAYSLYFDSLDNDVNTTNQNIQFTSGRNFVLSTPRSESGDDYLIADYQNIVLDQTNLFFTGVEDGTFSAGTFTILADDITLSSDDRESINFHISSLNLTATHDLHFTGDSITFASLTNQTTIQTVDDFTLNNDDRGLMVNSNGTFEVSANTSTIATPDNILIDSDANIAFSTSTGPFIINAEDSVDVVSDAGPVALSSNGPFVVNSGNDIYLNTGDYQGDLFSTSSRNVNFYATDDFSTSVSAGNLDINVISSANLESGDISFVGQGVVNIQTAAYTLTTNFFDSFGGNIDVSSTQGDITFIANDFLINSTEPSLAAQELDDVTYEILFSSGDDIFITTSAPGGQIFSNSDQLVIEALKPQPYGQEGQILFSGADATLTSNLLNQFIQFSSGGLINITAVQDVNIGADGDYFIQAANSAQFYAQSIHHNMQQSITIDAVSNSCVNISHIGDNLNFYVTTATVPKFYNDLEFKSTDFLYIQAGDGPIVATALGVSTKRQNEDGNTNGDLIFNEEISVSVRSRNELGNIIFEAQDDVVDFSADDNTIIGTLQQALFYSLTGQSYTSGTTTKFEAKSGNVTMRAGHDYTLTASGSLFFASTENTTSLAEDYIHMTFANELEITANSGDIFFNTYYKNDINIDGQDVFFTSGTSGAKFIAQGDISVSSTEFTLTGERGINLLTNIGPILFDSSAATSLSSSEELFVKSGNNVVTNSITSTSFAGRGVVFGSTAADVLMQANTDILLSSKTAVLQSLGTSQTGRDRVAFNSADITFQSLSAYVDATELVQIGKTTLPVVSITASGTEAISGVVMDVAASTSLITSGKLTFTSILGENNITATSGATFDAEGAVNIQNSNFDLNAITGYVQYNAHNNISITAANDATYTSDHLLLFTSTGADATDGIVFQYATLLSQSGHFLDIIIDDLYSVETDDFTYFAPEQGGGVRYEAPQGVISISTTNNATFVSRSDLTMTSNVDSTFTSQFLTLQTLYGGEFAPITLQAQNDFSLSTSKTASFSGDYVTLTAIGPGADIALTSPLISLLSTEGSFISNSTQGSQSISALSSTMLVDNYVEFKFADITPFNVKTGNFHVSSEVGSITAGDTLDMTATLGSFTTQSANDLTFTAFDTITLVPSTTLALTFQSTNEDIFVTTTNDLNHLHINAASLGVTSYSLNLRAGSEQERQDLRLSTKFLSIRGTQTSFIAEPTGVRVATPVTVDYPTFSFSSGYITFNSTSDEEGFGGIFIGDPDLVDPLTLTITDDLYFTSEQARLITEVRGTLTFTGTAASMLMNTNGLDTFIKFDATTQTTVGGTNIQIFSREKTRIASDAGDLNVEAASLAVDVNGPNDGDGLGIAVTGTYSTLFDSSSLIANVDATRFTALVNIGISSPIVAFDANTILINAQGGRENPLYSTTASFYNPYRLAQLDFVGINMFTPALVVNADTDLTFKCEVLENNGNFDALIGGDVQYNAKENYQITTTGVTTIHADDFELYTKKGMTLQGVAGTLESFQAADTMLIQGGNDAVDSKILFSAVGGAIAVTANTGLIQYSNDNILYESRTAISVSSAADITFRATRGDILFRAIDVNNVHSSAISTFGVLFSSENNDIILQAGRSIRHINHYGLGVFSPEGQGYVRPAAPRNVAGNLVPDNGVFAPSAECSCPGYPSNCYCTDTANRIVQMYQAFLNYGLIQDV